ncbi:hypothetical protein DIPPA_18862 [Diplonema papillatum]|nr:hypothetical protein DIPPA_18893 [Diplonema papillatum]KAJ9454464.1 hypothetical protein DIPPA_18862 [Diplonema papillatum]
MAFAVTREFEATTRWAVPLLLVLSELWHDDSALWLSTLGYTFTAFFGLVCTMSGLKQLGARYFTMCQPDKNFQLDLLDVEIKATALSLFVASCLAAWPLTFWREGKEVACKSCFQVLRELHHK